MHPLDRQVRLCSACVRSAFCSQGAVRTGPATTQEGVLISYGSPFVDMHSLGMASATKLPLQKASYHRQEYVKRRVPLSEVPVIFFFRLPECSRCDVSRVAGPPECSGCDVSRVAGPPECSGRDVSRVAGLPECSGRVFSRVAGSPECSGRVIQRVSGLPERSGRLTPSRPSPARGRGR